MVRACRWREGVAPTLPDGTFGLGTHAARSRWIPVPFDDGETRLRVLRIPAQDEESLRRLLGGGRPGRIGEQDE
jgi:hypothetical protein